jgi:hypothetical protein
MATKGQIIRLAARIEGLVQQTGLAVAYVWRDLSETEEQALERHYGDQPQDRSARCTYVLSWKSSGSHLK